MYFVYQLKINNYCKTNLSKYIFVSIAFSYIISSNFQTFLFLDKNTYLNVKNITKRFQYYRDLNIHVSTLFVCILIFNIVNF